MKLTILSEKYKLIRKQHFYDFHEAILKSVGYANDQMTSFFICDDDWEKEKEVTLEEMDDNPEIDSWVMKDTAISELVEDEKQKLLYVFDYMTERCFFIELIRNYHRKRYEWCQMYQEIRRCSQTNGRF